jgi:hypothetical protein
MLDQVTLGARVTVRLEREPTPPRFPCPDCGAETKEHLVPFALATIRAALPTKGWRICSNPACRVPHLPCSLETA